MSRGAVCPGHRPQNSQGILASIAGIAVPVSSGTRITAQLLNDLRANISAEIDWWNNHADYAGKNASLDTSVRSVGEVADQGHLNTRQAFLEHFMSDVQVVKDDRINSATIPAAQADNNTFNMALFWDRPQYTDFISIDDINHIITELNNLRVDCICNADCNCNNVCACHGNCGCNYSDRKLKMEIYYC